MKIKLHKAIVNNNGLYEAVFAQFQIKYTNNGFIWYSLEETPPLYSNLVTVRENWTPDQVLSLIENNFQRQNWSEWSIKDSFGVLDLTQFGFSRLFEANWFYLEAENFSLPSENSQLYYEIIENQEVLSKWKLAWDADEVLGNKIFSPKLLGRQNVFFIAGFREKQIVSGCLVNQTDDVLGISNFFSPDENVFYWSGLIEFIYNSISVRDIVGYGRNKSMGKLDRIGFENIGNLTVWLKKRLGKLE